MSKSNTNPNVCRCGCAEATSSSKTLYKPGHDARHAGNVARSIVAGQPAELINELPTDALQAKALAMVERLRNKPAKRSRKVKADEPQGSIPAEVVDSNGNAFEDGTVKIGRWEYPARKWEGGVVERNTKRDGSGDWEPTEAPFVA